MMTVATAEAPTLRMETIQQATLPAQELGSMALTGANLEGMAILEKLNPFNLEVGIAERAKIDEERPDRHSQDRLLADQELGLFAVFDGFSKSQKYDSQGQIVETDGGAAAETGRLGLKDIFSAWKDVKVKSPEYALQLFKAGITHTQERIGESGQATGAITKLFEIDGKRYAAWAATGDARVYHKREGVLSVLNKDEISDSGKPTNWFGHGTIEGAPSFLLQEFGIIELQAGDEMLLITDGIHGNGDVFEGLSRERLQDLMNKEGSAAERAQGIDESAMKNDDRSTVIMKAA